MSDLGTDTGQAALNLSAKTMEKALELLKVLLSIFKKDYNQKLAKLNYKQKNAIAKLDKTKDKKFLKQFHSYMRLKRLKESGYELSYAKVEMSKKQINAFLKHASKRGIPVSYISNGKDENGKKTYLAVYRTMDEDKIMDITDQLVRDAKIEGIEKAMDEKFHYQKKTLDSAIKSVDGKIINESSPIIICDKDNPNNHIKVTGTQKKYDDGRPYVESLYEVYVNGEKVKCNEFKHNEFRHNCNSDGKNSSIAGDEHWTNMKSQIKDNISNEVLVFKNEKDYEAYISSLENDREQAEKDSAFYDELQSEKEKVVKDDIDKFNEKQAQSLFEEISGDAKGQSMTFADTVDHFQIGDWEKDEPYYICKRTDPDNYIEVQVEQKTDHNGETYNEHTYNVYVDDVQVSNPHREDGKFVDERFEGRPADYWKNMKDSMQEIGKFDNDCVVFVDKNDYLKYRQIYQQEHAQIKDPTNNFNKDASGLRNDYAYVQEQLESCKNDIKKFEDIGTYSDGSFSVNTKDDGTIDMQSYKMNEVRFEEAYVICEQISNYQDMVTAANELMNEKAKLEALENSDLKNSDVFTSMYNDQVQKVAIKEDQLRVMQNREENLWKQREQITGVKSEVQLRRGAGEGKAEKTIFSEQELKDFAKSYKQNPKETSIGKEAKTNVGKQKVSTKATKER